MSTDYLPAKDSELLAFALNYSTLITATPTAYGLTAAQATALAADVSTFSAALTAATNPSTRTKVTVAAKDAAKVALKAYIRTLANVVQATMAVSNAARASLGLTVQSMTSTSVPTPGTYPVLTITPDGSLQHHLTFSDSATPTSKAKPAGAKTLVLFCSTGTVAGTDQTTLPLNQLVTSNDVGVGFPSTAAGKVASYAGRWANAKGEMGPWSPIVSVGVAA